jgi:crotonobetaine/carnitine-CoA ligase
LNAGLTGEDLMHWLRDAAAEIVIVEPESWARVEPLRGALPERTTFICTGAAPAGAGSFADLLAPAARPEPTEIHPGDPAMIIYSGGTTGLPKGIVLPHFALVAVGLRYGEVTGAGKGDRHFTTLPLFHVGGTQLGLIGPLCNDVTTVIDRRFSASGYWARVAEVGATIIDPIGTMMTVLTQAEPRPEDMGHGVRFCFGVTGQIPTSVPSRFAERFGIPVVDIYGLTESGGAMLTSNRPPDGVPGSVGRPHGWSEIMIADALDQPLPPGAEGEILMRPVVPFTFMIGYHNNPDATARTLRNMWLHTGDLGRLDEEGNLFFIGRQAHWLRRRGENISAYEVENILTRHPKVREVVVVGVPAELGEEDVKACIIPEGPAFDPVDLIEWSIGQMALFKVPRYVEFMDDFPRSVTKREVERAKVKALGNEKAWDRDKVMGHLSSQSRRQAS